MIKDKRQFERTNFFLISEEFEEFLKSFFLIYWIIYWICQMLHVLQNLTIIKFHYGMKAILGSHGNAV